MNRYTIIRATIYLAAFLMAGFFPSKINSLKEEPAEEKIPIKSAPKVFREKIDAYSQELSPKPPEGEAHPVSALDFKELDLDKFKAGKNYTSLFGEFRIKGFQKIETPFPGAVLSLGTDVEEGASVLIYIPLNNLSSIKLREHLARKGVKNRLSFQASSPVGLFVPEKTKIFSTEKGVVHAFYFGSQPIEIGGLSVRPNVLPGVDDLESVFKEFPPEIISQVKTNLDDLKPGDWISGQIYVELKKGDILSGNFIENDELGREFVMTCLSPKRRIFYRAKKAYETNKLNPWQVSRIAEGAVHLIDRQDPYR